MILMSLLIWMIQGKPLGHPTELYRSMVAKIVLNRNQLNSSGLIQIRLGIQTYNSKILVGYNCPFLFWAYPRIAIP